MTHPQHGSIKKSRRVASLSSIDEVAKVAAKVELLEIETKSSFDDIDFVSGERSSKLVNEFLELRERHSARCLPEAARESTLGVVHSEENLMATPLILLHGLVDGHVLRSHDFNSLAHARLLM
jgi:hypothetical protein